MTTRPLARWSGFAPYLVVAIVHVIALATGSDAIAGPTKLWLMPLLAMGVLWACRGEAWGLRYILLLLAIALSWLGDGAAVFFPFAEELPMMLLCFGVAHVVYIWLFLRHAAVRRRLPAWTLVYGVVWVMLIAFLWPHLGGLALAVAAYGAVLAGTAIAAARCGPVVTVGGALFLTSDSLLAFWIFVPETPQWISPLVMLTYCLGQGLLAAGVTAQASPRMRIEART